MLNVEERGAGWRGGDVMNEWIHFNGTEPGWGTNHDWLISCCTFTGIYKTRYNLGANRQQTFHATLWHIAYPVLAPLHTGHREQVATEKFQYLLLEFPHSHSGATGDAAVAVTL